ncbi:MAG: HPr family phosphocarrier protein [Candidatus Binatia bacterium]|jgi:phosphocarrier protein HPr
MSPPAAPGGTVLCKNLEIKNRLGLHARAAAQLVQTAAQFDAEITVGKDNQVVNGKSIIGLMMLAAAQGSCIDVSVSGPQAVEALEAIELLVEAKFNEE